jgi:hypothetical protein
MALYSTSAAMAADIDEDDRFIAAGAGFLLASSRRIKRTRPRMSL